MAHYDFREYLDALAAAGELVRVEAEVDPELEAGAIAQRLAERGGPAVHLTNLAGVEGASLVGGTLSRGTRAIWSKAAIALDLDPSTSYATLLDEVVKRVDAPIKPLQVKSGPVKEVVLAGEDVDLGALPAPLLHEGDGGRYLTSWAVAIAGEPGSGYVAWDLLPMMVTGRNRLAGAIPPESPIGRLLHQRYAPEGKPMPLAVAIGTLPVAAIAAGMSLARRRGTTAAEIAGGLQREPLHLVKAEESDLLVPASAEIVLEGVLRSDKEVQAGPFASVYGYRGRAAAAAPVFEVTTITRRQDPVLAFSTWGTPISDIHVVRGLDQDVQLRQAFDKRGWPITDVFSPPWLAGSFVAVASKIPFSAFSQSIAGVVRSTDATRTVPYIAVYDDDIDLRNPVSLFHALVTKCHPKRDTWFVKESPAAADAPHLTDEELARGSGPSVIFDCTWPRDWDPSIAVPPRVSFDQCYPQAIQEKVLASWSTDYGFPLEDERPAT